MTYFPKIEEHEAAPWKCPGCDKWFVANPNMAMMFCTVNHGAGTCCHFADFEVNAPAPVPAVPREETSEPWEARLRTLYDALPFEQRMRFGGDFAEFCEGLDVRARDVNTRSGQQDNHLNKEG